MAAAAAARKTSDDDGGKIIQFPRDQVSRAQRPAQPIATWFGQILSHIETAQREFNTRAVPDTAQVTKVYSEVDSVLSSIYEAMEQIDELDLEQNQRELMKIWSRLESRRGGIVSLLNGIAENLLQLQIAEVPRERHAKPIQQIRSGFLDLVRNMRNLIRDLQSLS